MIIWVRSNSFLYYISVLNHAFIASDILTKSCGRSFQACLDSFSTMASGTSWRLQLPLNVYSTQTFSPHDPSLDHNENKKWKKWVYPKSRLVQRRLFFIDGSNHETNHTVAIPAGVGFSKLILEGCVIEFSCKMAWGIEETRQDKNNVSPFPSFHLLWPKPMRHLVFCKNCNMNSLQKLFVNGKNIDLLQVCSYPSANILRYLNLC